MSEIKGIYAASLSVLDENLALNINKTIDHIENLIEIGCHGVAVFGSTGQAQLISIGEKIKLINNLQNSRFKDKYLIGTGLNSLSESINFIRICNTLNFKKFLIMPPAYYKYSDKDVINFYSKIIEQINDCKIILYNFEKLSGYKFSLDCVKQLVKKFPKQIIGVKDSSYNLYKDLKIENFSILPGSEIKLLEGLHNGCSGIITATCNVTSKLARKVYEDYLLKKKSDYDEKLCNVRKCFDKYNLISGIHSYMSKKDKIYKNILPPLSLLNEEDEKNLVDELNNLDFNIKKL